MPESDQTSLFDRLPPLTVLAQAVTYFAAAGLASLATHWGMSAKSSAGFIAVVAAYSGSIAAALAGVAICYIKSKKIHRAETIAPGITRVPKGSETSIQLTVNNPSNADPPVVSVNNAKNTP